MKKFAFRILGEIFPFFFFLYHSHKKQEEASTQDSVKRSENPSAHDQLDEATVATRLQEEHRRAKLIDEKTVKFTLSISIALTVVSTIGSYYSKMVQVDFFGIPPSTIISLSVLYALVGGLLSLGALKTLPQFGYGTEFLINKKNGGLSESVKALVAQEKINLVRHMRNESAYQCLRNGLVILILSIMLLIPFQSRGISYREKDAAQPMTELLECVKKSKDGNRNYNTGGSKPMISPE